MKNIFILILAFSLFSSAHAQIDDLNDVGSLYAATKQVNQFFRRFNNEENAKGIKYNKSDKNFRNNDKRREYLMVLFNNQNRNLSPKLKNQFIDYVSNKEKPFYIDFHGGKWFAQVEAEFTHKGKKREVTLYLKLQEEIQGSKWVLTRAYYSEFDKLFYQNKDNKAKFLHPLSHELDFMNLQKTFSDSKSAEYYAADDFYPDHLSLLLYELKKGSFKFKTIRQVKFHFFQVDNWYFELSKFNRGGYNTGWLISNAFAITEEQKNKLTKFIFKEQKE